MKSIQNTLNSLNRYIENYIPSTKWEQENNRYLKRLISERTALEKAIEKKEQDEKWKSSTKNNVPQVVIDCILNSSKTNANENTIKQRNSVDLIYNGFICFPTCSFDLHGCNVDYIGSVNLQRVGVASLEENFHCNFYKKINENDLAFLITQSDNGISYYEFQ